MEHCSLSSGDNFHDNSKLLAQSTNEICQCFLVPFIMQHNIVKDIFWESFPLV